MKHAIMVIGYGNNAKVLQSTINVLDDADIDFFIHWDKRYSFPNLKSKKSRIYFLKNRIAVKWGSGSLIKATVNLMQAVLRNNGNYDYVHLISGSDMPLMTRDYFKNYFNKEVYIGFSSVDEKEVSKRLLYFYPNNLDFRKSGKIFRIITYLNKLFHVNRLAKYSNLSIEKGPEWFSLREKYIKEILNNNLDMFYHSDCADELLVPTLLRRFKDEQLKISFDDSEQAARYIDWKRGKPYSFKEEDITELSNKINTHYAFARKINDAKIIQEVFQIANI